jgi:hypothetical protein
MQANCSTDRPGHQGGLGSAIFESMEVVYNRRLHTALGCLSPTGFEARHTTALTTA